MSSSSSSAPEGRDGETGRLGGARADFVASLGRKVADARDLLSALEDEPSSKLARDELRRRLHALGSGARLLRFDAMARSIQDALVVLERAAQAGSMREPDLVLVAQSLDDLPALAWGDAAPAPRPERGAPGGAERDAEGDDGRGRPPATVLVVGEESLADPFLDDSGTRPRAYECERTADVDAAVVLARAYAPDLVVVDGDAPSAGDLVQALLDDPLTEPVPIVVLGTFRGSEEAARFVALGVARALPKPVPPETLRSVCDEVLDAREERTVRVTLGEPTLEQLAARLADELKRALVESVDRTARAVRVPLGEGTEVLGALWGAIARVQEIVSQRTGGAVRFGGDAPEGAIALAPWLHHDLPGADRMAGRGRGAAADVRLHGRRIVVADDDPGVTWFISDLLRTAGCEVHEALDGRSALDLVFRVQPELVVSDILMPGLDGFALSRALRRDIALRDTPVILLSWKEDLLQRVRELGASAAAYMRKESDSRAILARVREVLRPRARIESRLRGDGEVRGRLDELSPRLLLELVGAVRKDARVAVRDATFLYEIDVRNGAPRKATRTASDGSFRSGERALASLLGVGAGRFVVTPPAEGVRGDLAGTLSDQLVRPIAAARGALAATTGAATLYVERIVFDRESLDDYLRTTPEPARGIVARVAEGTSPRQLLLGGDLSPALLEDVLADVAAHGAVRAVEGADGTDLLTPAVETALAVLRGAARPSTGLPPNARPSAPSPAAPMRGRTSIAPPTAPSGTKATMAQPSAPAAVPVAAPAPPPAPARMPSHPAFTQVAEAPILLTPPPPSPPPEYIALKLSEPPPPPAIDEDSGVPSSLEDAVMRQLSERSPFPGPTLGNAPTIMDASELRPRSSNPPPVPEEESEGRQLPSLPPDAMVPDTSAGDPLSGDHVAASAGERQDATPEASPKRSAPMPPAGAGGGPIAPAPERITRGYDGPRDMSRLGTAVAGTPKDAPPPHQVRSSPLQATLPLPMPVDVGLASTDRSPGAPVPERASAAVKVDPKPPPAPPPMAEKKPAVPSVLGETIRSPGNVADTRALTRDPSPALARPGEASPARPRWPGVALAFAVLGVAVGAVIYVTQSDEEAAARAHTAESESAPAPQPTPSAPPRAAATATATVAIGSSSLGDELPPGAEVPAGYGLLEVTATPTARVRVDGALIGAGAELHTALPPGLHDVVIDEGGRESRQSIEVRAGKTAHARSAPSP